MAVGVLPDVGMDDNEKCLNCTSVAVGVDDDEDELTGDATDREEVGK